MSARGARLVACLVVCATVAATFSGCDRLVFGAKAREARVLDAVRRGDDVYRGVGSAVRIERRWIDPPLLGTEFFEVIVEDDRLPPDHRSREFVALDNRARPLLLSGIERQPLALAYTRGLYDRELNVVHRVNELLSRENIEVSTSAEARQLAILVARLFPSVRDVRFFGEPAFDAGGSTWKDSIASLADLHAPPNTTVSEQTPGRFDVKVAGLYDLWGRWEVVEWTIGIAQSRVTRAVGRRLGRQF